LGFIALNPNQQTIIAATSNRVLPRFRSSEINFVVPLPIYFAGGKAAFPWAMTKSGRNPTCSATVTVRLLLAG
jgi:hypothetical protein